MHKNAAPALRLSGSRVPVPSAGFYGSGACPQDSVITGLKRRGCGV